MADAKSSVLKVEVQVTIQHGPETLQTGRKNFTLLNPAKQDRYAVFNRASSKEA